MGRKPVRRHRIGRAPAVMRKRESMGTLRPPVSAGPPTDPPWMQRMRVPPCLPTRPRPALLARHWLVGAMLVAWAAAAQAQVQVQVQVQVQAADVATFTHACPAAPAVQVRAVQAADAAAVCDGAARAWPFLAGLGLQLPGQTLVDIVERLPGDLDGRALGCYDPDTRRVQLLSRAAFDATGGWFGQPPDAELYRSAATHEMAHAVVGCQPGARLLPVPAHEYAAYVAMFATMAAPLRARVLAHYPGQGFDSTLQINSLVYIGDPLQFAADAWRHYQARRDGPAWLRAVVAGEVVQDLPTDGP